jgi:hypothetical protein
VTSPHDALFRFVFGDCEHARGLLASAMPAAIAANIDWSTLERQPEPHVDERVRERICDLLFRCTLHSGRPLLLYLVLEHKSEGRRFDVLQMLDQVVAVLKEHRRRHPDDAFLPAVMPILTHVGDRVWTAPVALADLFDLDTLPADIARHLPALTIRLDDVQRAEEQDLRGRALSLAGLWCLASLRYLPGVRDDPAGFARWLATWADVIEQVVSAPTGQEAVRAISSYAVRTSRLPRVQVEAILQNQLTEPAMKEYQSTYDEMIDQVRKQRGAEVLIRLLHRRFGALADACRDRVFAGSDEEVDRWVDRVLDAATIDDVFGED